MRALINTVRGLLTAAATIASASLPLCASAQESSGEDRSSVMDKVVVTDSAVTPYTVDETAAATKLPLSLRETPQSVTMMTRERLDDQNLFSLRDVLDHTPGVYSYQYDTERVVFTARGFKIDSLQYDGVPAVTNFNTDSLDETLDTALYDRIEIVRGATGLTTGAGSPAASVNLVRKHAESKELQTQFTATAGSWADYRAVGDISAPLNTDGTIRARMVGVYQDRDSYQDLYHAKKTVFYGIVDADLTPDTHASLGVDYQNYKPQSNTWGSFPLFLSDGTPADWSRSVTTATDWSFWDRKKKTVFGELKHSFENEWALRANANWRKFDENLALFYVEGFPDPQTGEISEAYAYRSTAGITEKALDIYASGPFNLFGRRHELVIGYNGSRADYSGLEFPYGETLPPVANFFQWDGSYPQPAFASEGTLLNDIDTKQNGFYTSARFVLADPLKLVAGARFNTFDTDYYYLYDSPVNGDYDHKKVIPYAGLIYDFGQNFSAFASYTEIFKPQNKKDVTVTFLDPIDGRSFEVGVKGEHFEGRLNTALTLFETRQNNVATAVTNPETGEAVKLEDGTSIFRPIDGTKTRGFEFEMSGQLRRGWNASLGWTRYDLEDADGADVLTYVPRTLIRGFTTWNAPGDWRKLTLGGGVNYQSSSYLVVGSPAGPTSFMQGDVTQVSLMARYQLTPNAAVQFNGENLLDKKYYVLDEYGNLYYGSPVNVSLGVTLKF